MPKSVDPNNPPPQQPSTPPPTDKKHKNTPPPQYKGTDKPMNFLGMHFTGHEAEKFWNALMQQVNTEIQQCQARALKALRKLKKSETSGDD